MYCSHCGAQLRDDVRFCSGCGAATAPGATPATAGTGAAARRFSVQAQGVDAAAQHATGDDTEVDLGSLTVIELGALVDRLLALPASAGECPPHLMIAGARGTVSVIIEGGSVNDGSHGRQLTREQLLARVTGEQPAQPEAPVGFPRAMAPLRRAELPATPPEVRDNPRLIDTGSAARQATVRVAKGRGANAMAWLTLWLGVFLAVIAALMSLPGPSSGGGGALWFLALLSVGAHLLLRKTSKASCSVGVDWKTNTLWFTDAAGSLAFEPHANCMRQVRAKHLRVGDGIQFVAGGMPVKRGRDVWTLEIEYADGKVFSALKASFLEKHEAEAVAQAASQLLA